MDKIDLKKEHLEQEQKYTKKDKGYCFPKENNINQMNRKTYLALPATKEDVQIAAGR